MTLNLKMRGYRNVWFDHMLRGSDHSQSNINVWMDHSHRLVFGSDTN